MQLKTWKSLLVLSGLLSIVSVGFVILGMFLWELNPESTQYKLIFSITYFLFGASSLLFQKVTNAKSYNRIFFIGLAVLLFVLALQIFI
jgi:Trk-type K+ transport system membrane component